MIFLSFYWSFRYIQNSMPFYSPSKSISKRTPIHPASPTFVED